MSQEDNIPKTKGYHNSLLLVTLISLLYKDINFLSQNFSLTFLLSSLPFSAQIMISPLPIW